MEENNRTPEEQGLEQKIKKAMMATLGTVAGAVEKAADMVSSAVTKENIDKMAEKGEQALQQAKAFGTSAFRQVKEMGQDAYDKVKETLSGEEEDDIRFSLNRAADSLTEAMDKVRDAVARAASRESMEEMGNSLLKEIGEQKEKIASLVQKLKDVAREEAEMAEEELREILDGEPEEEKPEDAETPPEEPEDEQ